MNKIDQKQIEILKNEGVRVDNDVSARTLTTFGSGGFVEYVVYPRNLEELQKVLQAAKGCKYHLLGGGSNTLISDNGLSLVISLKEMKGLEVEGNRITAQAGEFLPKVASVACNHSLSGLEFTCGIAGSVGGAVKMNAGAFGGDISQVCSQITLLKDGEIRVTTPKELKMTYRDGGIRGDIVLQAVFELCPKDKTEIENKMNEYRLARAERQPKEASAGSVFKRINGRSAAVYIQGCGLKGVRIGGAAISGKHANFIVNMGGATTRDYLRLVDKIVDAVRERYNLELEAEFEFMRD